MKIKNIIIPGTLGLLAGAFYFFVLPTSNTAIGVVLGLGIPTFFATLLSSILLISKKVTVPIVILIALPIVFFIRVFIDETNPNVDHNLLPFEMIVLGVISIVSCLIAMGVGSVLNRNRLANPSE